MYIRWHFTKFVIFGADQKFNTAANVNKGFRNFKTRENWGAEWIVMLQCSLDGPVLISSF